MSRYARGRLGRGLSGGVFLCFSLSRARCRRRRVQVREQGCGALERRMRACSYLHECSDASLVIFFLSSVCFAEPSPKSLIEVRQREGEIQETVASAKFAVGSAVAQDADTF